MIRRNLDLLAVAAAAWALVGLVQLGPLPAVRAAVGLAVALFCPGYACLAAAYPREGELEPPQRIGLAAGLSIAIAAVVGVAISMTPAGLGPGSSALALATVVTGLAALAALQRARAPVGTSTVDTRRRKFTRPLLLVLALVAVFGLAGVFVYRIQMVAPEPFTEFYVLNSEHAADDYSAPLTAGQASTYTLIIVNQERRPMQYEVRALLQDREAGRRGPVHMENKERTELRFELTPTTPIERAGLEFQLFRIGDTAPYHRVHLWVRVLAEPTPKA